MVAESTTVAGRAPWLVVVPGTLIVLSVACASLLGDAFGPGFRKATFLNLGYASAIAVVIFALAIIFIITYLVRATKQEVDA